MLVYANFKLVFSPSSQLSLRNRYSCLVTFPKRFSSLE